MSKRNQRQRYRAKVKTPHWADGLFDRGPAVALAPRRRRPQQRWTPYGPNPFDWGWVTDQLATGGMPTTKAEMDKLVREGVTHIVCTAGDMPATAHSIEAVDGRVNFLYNPTDDDYRPKGRDWFERTARFVVPALEAGDKAYVHCIAGSNRGPSSAYYVLRAMGTPPDDAEALIRAARPNARVYYIDDAEAALEAEEARYA